MLAAAAGVPSVWPLAAASFRIATVAARARPSEVAGFAHRDAVDEALRGSERLDVPHADTRRLDGDQRARPPVDELAREQLDVLPGVAEQLGHGAEVGAVQDQRDADLEAGRVGRPDRVLQLLQDGGEIFCATGVYSEFTSRTSLAGSPSARAVGAEPASPSASVARTARTSGRRARTARRVGQGRP